MSLNRNRALKEIAKIRCRELRRNSTKAEKIFWKQVRNRNFLGLKFNSQFPIFVDMDCAKVLEKLQCFMTHPQTPSLEKEGAFKSPSLFKRRI